MGPGRRTVAEAMTVKRRRKIDQILAAGSSEARLVRRARIVLLAAGGAGPAEIARVSGCSLPTARVWPARFAARGIPGLFDRPRPGRPPVHGPSARLAVVATATSFPPSGASVWTHRTLAGHLAGRGLRVSPATVGRVLAEAEVRPHRVRGWLHRADNLDFWRQAGEVCRLYLDGPAEGTLLLSVDEKTGIQAKSRRHPEIPARLGRDARREFEYVRHGTVSILAAMDVFTGQVLAHRIGRNDSRTFLDILVTLDQCTAPDLRIHLILDNGSSHTSAATRAWFAAHPRFTVTYTPKHASWLNMVEQWFGALTRRLLRRGDFTSREDLEQQIIDFTLDHNTTATPYQWRYDAEAEHARYLDRHPAPQPQPATDALPTAA
ncbi:IS630 family transposase [Pseudofrankia sp. DC12]|uniref:IS630 family transposase n=1 Tax=Pseudofrankia sp. DC12 TaxID=683315 RepID=UPI0005F783B3|nr:IS630 family transposase [Pseudofrankia sp. DC12]